MIQNVYRFVMKSICHPWWGTRMVASIPLHVTIKIYIVNFGSQEYPIKQITLVIIIMNAAGQQDHPIIKTQQPFIRDSTFKKTIYPEICVSTIAIISCIILITAILCPLWLHAVQNINRESVDNTNTNTNTSTSAGTNRRRRRNRRLGMIQPSLVSGYNLYLVYLAIPDMILNVFLLGMYSSYALQKYNPTESTFSGIMIIDLSDDPFEGAFVIACSTANLVGK
jgi:hypothetical protein